VADSHRHARRHRGWLRILAVGATVALIAAACGGSGGDGGGGGGGGGSAGGDTGAQFGKPDDEGTPQRGGKVIYGLEAETGGGWCLPGSQLAAGGIEVAVSIYDTLMAPGLDDNGDLAYYPFLAESVEHNETYDQWTIKVREGITFHDGTPLDAAAVKLNLDNYRGQGTIGAPLFTFVFEKVSDVQVVDDRTVQVNMEAPWVGFDAFLWGTGRIGMVAPAQLNNADTCNRNLIGTGPFRMFNCENADCGWTINDKLVAEANPDYWRTDADGEKLPYLDEIEFRPVIDAAQRVNGLKGGELNLIHTTDGQQISALRDDAEAGTINLLESDFEPEISYTMLNTSKAPFDNQTARLALAYAADPQEFIDLTQDGVVERAFQPFGPESPAYVNPEELDYPEHDLDRAKELVAQFEEETGGPLQFAILSTTAPETVALAQLVQSQAEAAGMQVTIDQVEQTDLINTALQGNFQAALWRNHPGGDPGTQYVWWYSTIEAGDPNFVNFSRINNPEIDRIFTEGRAETDPAARAELYQGIPKVFAEEAYNLWGWYTLWAFAAASDVHGLYPPPLPDGQEAVIIASVQPTAGLWVGE
jgi:peptide/nickel transport system substrate-binding protein